MPNEPIDPSLDPQAQRLVREAEGYRYLGLWEEALHAARDLLSRGQAEKFARYVRAECLRALGRWEEGVRAFREILERDPKDIEAHVGLGWCEKRAGRLHLAIEAMERLLAAHPREGIGLYNLACYLCLRRETERALDLLRKSIDVDSKYRELAGCEEDFAALVDDPRFRALLGSTR